MHVFQYTVEPILTNRVQPGRTSQLVDASAVLTILVHAQAGWLEAFRAV